MKHRHPPTKPTLPPHGRRRIRISVELLAGVLLLAGLTVIVSLLMPMPRPAAPSRTDAASRVAASGEWQPGQLRPDGLRIVVSGRFDASHVMDPNLFSRPQVSHSYWVAAQIPALLNKLYCWCGCENRGVHRSALACFEDRMAEDCDVCRGTAEIAYEMSQKGITDAAKVQAAVDVVWGPT